MTKYCLIICFVLLGGNLLAQKYADKSYYLVDSLILSDISSADKIMIDSCMNVYHNTNNDTLKIKTINHIIENTWDEKVWPKYNFLLQKQIEHKIKLNTSNQLELLFYKKHYAGCLINTGYYYRIIGNIKLALQYYNRSYLEYEKLGVKQGLAYCLNNIGVIYDSYGDIPKALENYQKSLIIQEEIKDTEGVANSLNNIGALYNTQGEKTKAIEYFEKSILLQKEIKNRRGEAMVLLKIGDVYRLKKEFEKAEKYINESLEIWIELENKSGKASVLRELGNLYIMQNDIKKAMSNYKESIEIFEEINDVEELVKGYNSLSALYLKMKNLDKTKDYASKGLKIAQEIGYTEGTSALANLLSQVYELENNPAMALKMHKLHITMRDSLYNSKNEKLTIRNQLQYEFDQKKSLMKIEKEKEIAIALEEKKRHQIINIAFGIGILLVSVFLIIIINRLRITNKQKRIISLTNAELNLTNEELATQRDKVEIQKSEIEKQKKIVEHKNQEITDSITYAKRIQESILPSDKLVNELLPNSFIIYKPKDIVAGDFYWVENVNEYIIFAVADCTGHGVPGAMVSVICHTALNRAVREHHLIEPAKILDKTREIIADNFQNSTDEVRDGMDIALCVYNIKTRKLLFSGANCPLYLARKDTSVIEIIKGDKQPVGYYEHFKNFTQIQMELEFGDTLYLFSDGFADQFGGINNKKMGYQVFRDKLLFVKDKPLAVQKQILESEFEQWKNGMEQVDDICVIGIKI